MRKIAIHSVPRSGSTWLGNIFNSHPKVIFKYQPLFSYAFKGFLTENSYDEKINTFFEKISKANDAFLDQEDAIAKKIVPNFKKDEIQTHICYKEVRYHNILQNMVEKSVDVKFIFLIRNPLAVLYSWKNAPKEFRVEKGWSFESEWQNAPSKNLNLPEEYNGYEKWKEANYLFLNLKNRFPQKVMILEYESLLKETEQSIRQAFDFAELDFNMQTLCFLKDSRNKNSSDSYAVYKTKISDSEWKNLPKHIIEYVNSDLNGTSLEKYL